MNLIYPGEWKFDGVGFEISNEADSVVSSLGTTTKLVLKC